ncbi:phosphoribosyl transferase domain protein [Apodospora peruviana]|uniref:Phosphoribosyl transferase domain protein n=1 Tax=Apodospora peruviana TaxID=516989 RepID=A0AAE0M1C7_9PEZI|nr:phosphoribosyl transferase domain protein [Apodospora peruviana]
MATLHDLKESLRNMVRMADFSTQPLSDAEYSASFDILLAAEWSTYQEFIVPRLSELIASRAKISVLEIGPGPKSVLGHLPAQQRRKIVKYDALEPNMLFNVRLEKWLRYLPSHPSESPLQCLQSPPGISRLPFVAQYVLDDSDNEKASDYEVEGKYDVVLFCHSMYGSSKFYFIERALGMLAPAGMLVVFHRSPLDTGGLVCQQTASFPAGVVRVPDDDETLDAFASFIAGYNIVPRDMDASIDLDWREMCRGLGRREGNHLVFSSPNIMMTFNQHAKTALPELVAQVPTADVSMVIKNREARLHGHPAAIMRPTEVQHVQQCVRWAMKNKVGLTVVGGSHSGNCLVPGVVAITMSAFDKVHVVMGKSPGETGAVGLVVAEAGVRTGHIVRKAEQAGVTVPLGARPSVGAGLWLQGGIGHLARSHGLASDSIVGAVMVGVDSAQALFVGRVPPQHLPAGAVRAENEADLLWAIKGAGTNFGIVISVAFEAYKARSYSTLNWVLPVSSNAINLDERRSLIRKFDELAGHLPRNCSADAYLYWNDGGLRLGVAMFESPASSKTGPRAKTAFETVWGTPSAHSGVMDGLDLFDAEMYVSRMHDGLEGGHGGGKTSSFKRCVLLKGIGAADVADILMAAIDNRPSPHCYLHLLQGGGAVHDIPPEATAFGCRDWDFACVITGVWLRDRGEDEEAKSARAAEQWVYDVVRQLLPLSCGVYGADLGPDPRDAALAAQAFGPNRPRLGRLKQSSDPYNMLAYACPLLTTKEEPSKTPELIVLVTGESGAGKDYCASTWAIALNAARRDLCRTVNACVVSISDVIKREYAAATGADVNRLLRYGEDRAYKEQHRPALTSYFQHQVRQAPQLPEEHFLNVVRGAAGRVDVLLITGMRDAAPVAAFSHLVPDSRLIEVRVTASGKTRRVRRGMHDNHDGDGGHVGEVKEENRDKAKGKDGKLVDDSTDYPPDFSFDNDTTGDDKKVKEFAETHLLNFFHSDLQRLASMVRPFSDFPRPGIEFRHVLDIAQQPGGLKLCMSLLRRHLSTGWPKMPTPLSGDWPKVIACCETGGFVFGSALALFIELQRPLALIRKGAAGKLPPPTVSVDKSPSHISSATCSGGAGERIEMGRDVIPRGASVLVVDDVLATGQTLCAVLQLLGKAGVDAENVSVMVVAEFPVHRGRELLRQNGFGKASVQSLLVFGGL